MILTKLWYHFQHSTLNILPVHCASTTFFYDDTKFSWVEFFHSFVILFFFSLSHHSFCVSLSFSPALLSVLLSSLTLFKVVVVLLFTHIKFVLTADRVYVSLYCASSQFIDRIYIFFDMIHLLVGVFLVLDLTILNFYSPISNSQIQSISRQRWRRTCA